MASEGTLNSVTTNWPNGGSSGGYFEFHWWTLEVNKAENKTKIAWTFKIKGYNGGYVATRWLRINSSWYGIGYPRDSYYPPTTGDTNYYYNGDTIKSNTSGMWINHNADGTGSFEVEIRGCISQSYDNTWYDGSGHYNTYLDSTTVTLDPILRTVTAVSGGHGTVGVSTTTANYSSSVEVASGSTVYGKATPSTGYHVNDWQVDGATVASNTTTYSAVVTQDSTWTVDFAINSHTLTLNTSTYAPTVSGGGVYNYAATVTATASLPADTAQYHYAFSGWYDNNNNNKSTLPVYSFTMPNNAVTLTAKGSRSVRTYPVVIQSEGAKVVGNVGSVSINLIAEPNVTKSKTCTVSYNSSYELHALIPDEYTPLYEFKYWDKNGTIINSHDISGDIEDTTSFIATTQKVGYLVTLQKSDNDIGGISYELNGSTMSGGTSIIKAISSGGTATINVEISSGTHTRVVATGVSQVTAYLDDYNWDGKTWLVNGETVTSGTENELVLTNITADTIVQPKITLRSYRLVDVTRFYNGDKIYAADDIVGNVNISFLSTVSRFRYEGINSLYIPDFGSVKKGNVVFFDAINYTNYQFQKYTIKKRSKGEYTFETKHLEIDASHDGSLFGDYYDLTSVEVYFVDWSLPGGANWKTGYIFVKTGDDAHPESGWRVVEKIQHRVENGWTNNGD